MERPIVSVIVPTFNGARFIGKALESVLHQTFQSFEIIVIDDGSTDDTREIISLFGPVVRYVYQDNKGRSNARNRGMGLARGQYIAFLDADDLFYPDKLALQVAVLDEHPHIGMVYSHSVVINENDEPMPMGWKGNLSGWIYPKILFIRHNFITTPTVMVRTAVIQDVGGFDEDLDVCEDLDLWRRIARRYQVGNIQQPLAKIRSRTGNVEWIEEAIRARTEYYEKAFREDPDLGKTVRNRLWAEMYFVYGLTAIDRGDFGYAISLIRNSFGHDPFNGMHYLLLSRKCTTYCAGKIKKMLPFSQKESKNRFSP